MGMNIRTKAKIRLNGRWREIISSFKALKTAMTKNKIMKPNISEIIRSDFFIPPAGFSMSGFIISYKVSSFRINQFVQ